MDRESTDDPQGETEARIYIPTSTPSLNVDWPPKETLCKKASFGTGSHQLPGEGMPRTLGI